MNSNLISNFDYPSINNTKEQTSLAYIPSMFRFPHSNILIFECNIELFHTSRNKCLDHTKTASIKRLKRSSLNNTTSQSNLTLNKHQTEENNKRLTPSSLIKYESTELLWGSGIENEDIQENEFYTASEGNEINDLTDSLLITTTVETTIHHQNLITSTVKFTNQNDNMSNIAQTTEKIISNIKNTTLTLPKVKTFSNFQHFPTPTTTLHKDNIAKLDNKPTKQNGDLLVKENLIDKQNIETKKTMENKNAKNLNEKNILMARLILNVVSVKFPNNKNDVKLNMFTVKDDLLNDIHNTPSVVEPSLTHNTPLCITPNELKMLYKAFIILSAFFVFSCFCNALICCCFSRKSSKNIQQKKRIALASTSQQFNNFQGATLQSASGTLTKKGKVKIGNMNNYDSYWIPNAGFLISQGDQNSNFL